MATSLVKLPPNLDLHSQNAANEWRWWKNLFEDYMITTGHDKAEDRVKVAILRNMMGPEASKVISTLPITDITYENLIRGIEKYVSPRSTEVLEKYEFNKRMQKEGEDFEHFLAECRRLLKNANYVEIKGKEKLEQQILRDKIVCGIRDRSLQEGLLRMDNLTLEKAENYCRASEQSKKQVNKINEESAEVAVVARKEEKNYQYKKKNFNQHVKEEYRKCSRCQRSHPPRSCPAYGRKCAKCGKFNHFAVCCRIRHYRGENNVHEVNECYSDSEEESLFCHIVQEDSVRDSSEFLENIRIEGKQLVCKLDTGADVSVMPLNMFNKINSANKITIVPFKKMLEGFEGSKERPLGQVNLLCEYRGKSIYENFILSDKCKTLILGRVGCKALNLIKRVYTVNKIGPEPNVSKSKLIKENISVFSGYGSFPTECNIPTREYEQICWPASRIPNALHVPLKEELDRLVERKAIAKVGEIRSDACINKIVIAEKPNGKIRLCLDPTDLNKVIMRKPKVMPTVDEISGQLKGKKFYSVFDLSEGFHHIKLTETASWKCCFNTRFGTYRYLVLPYGLKCSPDIFQEEVEKYFGAIPNVYVWFDDILIAGETEEIHDQTVKLVIEKAKEINAVFNKEKIQFKQKEVRYIGQIFCEEGMKVDPCRVESLVKLKSPANKEELQRIVGSFNYVRRYYPDMAETLAPLCKLLKKNIELVWLPMHEKCFQELKDKISKAPALSPFDPSKPIILQCDASQNGIGCCLFQEHNKILKLVACVSRNMTDCELGYSQSEKELLSICYGASKFHKYIYGVKEILVQTDHKPLISIMNKHIEKIGSIRLLRLRLKLLMYSLKLSYVPGKYLNFADMLSRHSLSKVEMDKDSSDIIHSVSVHLPMSQERKTEFRNESSKDPLLQKLNDYFFKGWPKYNKLSNDCKKFYKIKDNLYVEAGMVFYGDKIVVPETLRKYILNLLHQGHPGVSKAIAKARQMFYWPNMSENIKDYIRKCSVCEKFRNNNYKEKLIPHKIPNQRYYKIGTDIGEYGGNNYLILIDYFSHWIEMRLLQSKTSKSVIDVMQDVFTRIGYPREIVADHVPFSSFECKMYFKSKDITLINSSPHYPRSNGLAEKAVGICKQILKKSFEDNLDYRESLMQYNNTPLSGYHASPSQILNSRIMRTNLPVTSRVLEPKIVKDTYTFLVRKQLQYKSHHDKTARRQSPCFQNRDSIVMKEGKNWVKAKILRKRKEPRSYDVVKGGKVYRRNTFHLKKSFTPYITERQVFEDYTNSDVRVKDKVINNKCYPSGDTQPPQTTRSGRTIKPLCRLDL